jgi:proteic killer suppression protein
MIRSFADKDTEALLAGLRVRAFPPDIARSAQRKAILLSKAKTLDGSAQPAGQSAEALAGRPHRDI